MVRESQAGHTRTRTVILPAPNAGEGAPLGTVTGAHVLAQ